MPTYSIKCGVCGKHDTFIAKVDDRNNTPMCCGSQTERTLDTPMVSFWTGWKGFHLTDGKNGGAGTFIESSDQFNRYLRENNKLCGEEGAREAEIQSANRLAEEDRKLDAAVEQAVLTHHNK